MIGGKLVATGTPANDMIYEALLEMHFHSAIIDHFANLYGAKFLKLLKPSPMKEAWVGFDQGWVNTSVSANQLFTDLQNAIRLNKSAVSTLFLGYFMQFKIVRSLRRSLYTPAGFPTPYFRAELDLKKNQTTGLSQHETLIRLSSIPGASVCYACGMLFDLADLYSPPDLMKLRCVCFPAPVNFNDDSRHFVAFRHQTDTQPKWCSEPVNGVSMAFSDWASPTSEYGPKMQLPEEVLDLIKSVAEHTSVRRDSPSLFTEAIEGRTEANLITRLIPESFTLIELEKKTDE
jgi:hypothetical protein